MVGISKTDTLKTICERLNLPIALMIETLKVLESMGLIQPQENHWILKPTKIHLPESSNFNSINHSNWRQRAVLDSQNKNTSGLHYTSAMTHSFKDFQVIKNIFLESIDKTREAVIPSKDEELTCLCIDFFKV